MANLNDYRCAIIVNGVYVGNIYLTDINNGTATYHIFIGDKTYWGKGVAKQASRQIIQYGFSQLRLHTICLHVRKANIRAHCLYQSLGFIDIAEEHDDWIHMSITAARYSAQLQDE